MAALEWVSQVGFSHQGRENIANLIQMNESDDERFRGWMGMIPDFYLPYDDIGPTEIEGMNRQPNFRPRDLYLPGNRLGAEGVRLLMTSNYIGGLEELDLGYNRLTIDDLNSMRQANLASLTALHLTRYHGS